MSPGATTEQALVELTYWIGRVQQYGSDHPACEQASVRALEGLTLTLRERSPLVLTVLRDDLLVHDAPAAAPLLKEKLAPHLHERGVLVVRFLRGLTRGELCVFVERASRPPEDVFEAGGLGALLTERGVGRVEVEEIAHEISAEDRRQDDRQRRIRDLFFETVRGRTAPTAHAGVGLADLLADPDGLARTLEVTALPAGLAEAVLALAARARTEAPDGALEAALREALARLGPEARDRLLTGLSALVEVSRIPLRDLLRGFPDDALARFLFPALAHRNADPTPFFALVRLVLPDALRRLKVVHAVARLLYDLPLEEPRVQGLLSALARTVDPADPHRAERAAMQAVTARIRADRLPFVVFARTAPPTIDAALFDARARGQMDHSVCAQIVTTAARTGEFGEFCGRLPALLTSLQGAGRTQAVLGTVRGLVELREPLWRGFAQRTLNVITASDLVLLTLRAVESLPPRELPDAIPLFGALAGSRIDALLNLLERAESRDLRRLVIEVIATSKQPVLPSVRQRLLSPEWFVVRNMLVLLRHLGGTAEDFQPVARHPKAQVRLEVARGLRARRGDRAAAVLLVAYLADPAEDVRDEAIAALAEAELDEAAAQGVVAFVNDDEYSEPARRDAVAALGRSRNDAAAGALYDLLAPQGLLERPSTAALRQHAAAALLESPAEAAPTLFEEALEEGKRAIQKACQRALDLRDDEGRARHG